MSFWSLFNLPNILTLINLFSGCLGIYFAFTLRFDLVPYCVAVSLIADYFDGFAARFTKTFTDLGKQLDSLADMVSFGMLPGTVLFMFVLYTYDISGVIEGDNILPVLYASPAFLVTLFSALRLAKFNIDTRQSDSFIGLATPASTIFVIGVLFMHGYPSVANPGDFQTYAPIARFFSSRVALYVYVVLLSLLMVAELPMFSFKFKSFGWKGNEIRYLFIILSVVLIATLKFAAVSLIIVLYILISVAQKLISK